MYNMCVCVCVCVCVYLVHFESVEKEKGKILLGEDCDDLRSHKCTDDLKV